MARLGFSKKKKSPRATELSQLKKELQRVTEQFESCKRELAEGIERETATGDILRVIASSPTDIQPVLDTVAENAARLSDASDAVIIRAEGESLKPVAHHGPVPSRMDMRYPLSRGFPGGRAVIDQQTIHIHDITAEIETKFPEAPFLHQQSGSRTVLATPLLREGVAIGAIVIRRTEVSPIFGEADRAAKNLRGPSRDRYRKRAIVQGDPGAQRRIARGPGASDGNG
jgi:transcriptional regulator with GAF, ATPase, and Fis domain